MSEDIYNFSEDCLTLNVVTPTLTSSKPLPVFVFIHGGAYYSGGSNFWNIENSLLASEQQIVVVNVNYRLGPLGFGAVESEFLGETTVGNFGLMDQYAALQWVQKNIGSFNGDPDKVTVSGESAGAESTMQQLLWKKSRENNKIKGAVLLSETWGLPFHTKIDAENQFLKLAEQFNCTEKLVESNQVDMDCMRELDAQELTVIKFPIHVDTPINEGTSGYKVVKLKGQTV